MDELTIPFLGAGRAAWQYPFDALRAAGARLAAGSDWPVSSPNPFEGLHVAVNRVHPGPATARASSPGSALTSHPRSTAYTAGART